MLYTNKFIIILKWRKFLYFSSFYLIFRKFTLTLHRWKVLHDLIFTRVQHYVDFDYLTKTSIINSKEFIVETLNYLGWESDLSTRSPRFFKYYLEVSMNTNQWKRLSWKTVYSMILANNNTKWVSSQLFGCGRAKLEPLGRGHLHHLVFITELLLVLSVGHMDPLLTLYSLLCVTKWQRNRVKFLKNLQKKDGHFEITYTSRCCFRIIWTETW